MTHPGSYAKPTVSELMTDAELGQALLFNAPLTKRVDSDWALLTSADMYQRSVRVITTMVEKNLAAVKRRTAAPNELKERHIANGTENSPEWLEAAEEYDEWLIRSTSFGKHADRALRALEASSAAFSSQTQASEPTAVPAAAVDRITQLALQLSREVEAIIDSIPADEELTPEEAAASITAKAVLELLAPASTQTT